MHKPKAGRDALPTIGLAGPRHLCVNAAQLGVSSAVLEQGGWASENKMPEKVVTVPFMVRTVPRHKWRSESSR